jgi:hypothetical protein
MASSSEKLNLYRLEQASAIIIAFLANECFKMTPQSDLELKGDLQANPLAELLVEISTANLNGSLRIASGEKKTIVYLSKGTVIYAVSNERQHRLFSLALAQRKLDQKTLSKFENFANDHELAGWLKNEQIIPVSDVNFLIIRQVETVIAEALNWYSGEWTFSPLARARGDMKVSFNLLKLVMEFGRSLSPDLIPDLLRMGGRC